MPNLLFPILCAAAFLGSSPFAPAGSTSSSAPSAADAVPDAATAIKIAVAAWKPIYGTQVIARHKPYLATLRRGVWHVEGSFGRLDSFGGPPLAEIAKADGRVLHLSCYR